MHDKIIYCHGINWVRAWVYSFIDRIPNGWWLNLFSSIFFLRPLCKQNYTIISNKRQQAPRVSSYCHKWWSTIQDPSTISRGCCLNLRNLLVIQLWRCFSIVLVWLLKSNWMKTNLWACGPSVSVAPLCFSFHYSSLCFLYIPKKPLIIHCITMAH